MLAIPNTMKKKKKLTKGLDRDQAEVAVLGKVTVKVQRG